MGDYTYNTQNTDTENMEVVMPTDIVQDPWGTHGKDWVWEDEPTPIDWSEWELESDWCWEGECLNEDWGQEGVDWEWEWYDEYYSSEEEEDEEEE